jgi:hypothetical protein
MPKRSRGEGFTGVRKAQSSRKSTEVSRQDKVLEGPEGQEKKRDFDVGNLVILRSPCTESSGKLESKWEWAYVIIKNIRPGA